VLDHPQFKGKYLVKLPKDFDREKPYPLCIGLHGGGQNVGEAEWAEKAYGYMVDKGGCIGVYPEVLQKRWAEWGGRPEEAQYVYAVLDAALRTWKIDTNRIYLVGDSMGGYGTWHIGGYAADRFAALASHAGGILRLGRNPWSTGILPNLRNTPIYFTHGAQDRPAPVGSDRKARQTLTDLRKEDPEGYEHHYTEFPDRGHSIPREELIKSMDWVLERKRDPHPKKLVWETMYSWREEFGWLRLEAPALGSKVVAEIKGQTVDIALTKADSVTIRLNSKLVDVTHAVTVKVGGRESFKGMPAASLAALAESARALDPERLYPYEIRTAPEY
jgi:predicted esterase